MLEYHQIGLDCHSNLSHDKNKSHQIELANSVFTPSAEEVNKAKRIIDAMEEASKDGKGAVSLDGRLIYIASIRMAESLIAKAKLCK